MILGRLLPIALGLSCGLTSVAEVGSFYKDPRGVFSTRSDETKSLNPVAQFGPVGMGIDLIQPAFTMRISNIEEGSPAAVTGKLQKGQVVISINGQKLADIDPRIQLGQILADAEAGDGILEFAIRDISEPVAVKIPVLGAYSDTWPLDCPKSEKIVRGFADYLAKPDSNKGFGGIGMLFLLSTGEEKDLAPVRDWVHALASKATPTYAWHLGYGGIPLTEYYLRTGDESAIPTIQRWVDNAVKGQYLDGWAGRGGVAGVGYGGGGGHLNAGGTAVVTFLLLAKECGVDVPDHALHGALVHFFRYAGRGNNPYGDNRPEVGFVDNGKNGNLAFAMAAAAALTPEGEESVYASARDACAMTSFYTTTFMLHGHTGGGIGEIWRSAAMGLLHDKEPAQYREFMDKRQWHYDLSRGRDGSFRILGGARYDNIEWGAGYSLAYTIPRKTLRITGAPRTEFSKPYPLPKQPWGTEADNVFLSLEAAPNAAGERQDLSGETLAKGAGRAVVYRLHKSGEVSDEILRRYAHHQDHAIRFIAANKALGINSGYIGWREAGGKVRPELVMEFLRSDDPRVRRAMLSAIGEIVRREKRSDVLTREIFNLAMQAVKAHEESWWVKDAALHVIGAASADWVEPHVDLLLTYLGHEEWWLQNAALTALTPVVADDRCYKKVLPVVGELFRKNQRWNLTSGPMGGIRGKLKLGSPAVQELAKATLKEAYTEFAGVRTAPGGQDITTTYHSQLEFLAASLADVPGGYDLLYDIAQLRFPNDPLPYRDVFLNADPEKFGPELRAKIAPIIRDNLVYEFIGKNRTRLLDEASSPRQSSYTVGIFDSLADLYRKVGVDDYDWHPFGPDLENATWDYHSFDPPEKQAYDISPWRYREVTYPAGMETWYAPDFGAAKAGWKRGQGPIGQFEGKLVDGSKPCGNPSCRHSHPMRSLWEKEVLLVRGTFAFPPLKPGHTYRVRVGTGQHVGSGDGYKIYINGKPLIETKQGVGRRQGAKPRGAYITKEFIEEFRKGPVTIAATSFLRYGNRAIVQKPPVPQGIFSMWLEEMKLPPVDSDAIRKSASVVPMLSMNWQVMQDPENTELQSDDDLFRWDGEFVANPEVLGAWKTVAQVKKADEFDPEKPPNAGRSQIASITFKEKGETGDMFWIWSGDMLMDLQRNQALHMTATTIGGKNYLFIEAGGFSAKNQKGWEPTLLVMERK